MWVLLLAVVLVALVTVLIALIVSIVSVALTVLIAVGNDAAAEIVAVEDSAVVEDSAAAEEDNFRFINGNPVAYRVEPLPSLQGLFSISINIRDKLQYIG